MQSSLESQPVQGPRPLRACAEEVAVSGAQHLAACEYCNSQKRSISSSSSAHYAPCPGCLRRPPATDSRSQKALEEAAERETPSYDTVACQQGTSHGYRLGQVPACAATQREDSMVQQRSNLPSYRVELASSHVSNATVPAYAEATESIFIDCGDVGGQRCRSAELRCNTGLSQFESGVVQEDYNNARCAVNIADVVPASSHRFLPGEEQQLRLREINARKPRTFSVERTLPSQLNSHGKRPFPAQRSNAQAFSTLENEQKCMISSPATCHLPGRPAALGHQHAALDVLDQELSSTASYHCTQYYTACDSPEGLTSTIQVDNETGSFTKATSDILWESTQRRPSPGVQIPSLLAGTSSTTAGFGRRSPSSVSTTACASSQHQSLRHSLEKLPPPNSSSCDLASSNARCHARPSEKSECFASMYPYPHTGKPPSPASLDQVSAVENRYELSPSSPAAVEVAGDPAESAATDLCGQVAVDPDSLTAPMKSCRTSERKMGAAELSTAERGSKSGLVPKYVSVASTVLAKENVPDSVVIESSASDIVVSCGLPPPESSAPVSLACRVLMRRFAAAAITHHAPATTGQGEGGEGKKAVLSNALGGACSSGLRVQQYEDCGWAWQEEGGGFLLLRLQRKQLDKGKVKSAGYEAFGREYGLFEGRSMNCAASWKCLSSHLGAPAEAEDFKSLINDMRRQFSGAAPAVRSSWCVLDSGNFSMQTDSRYLPFGHLTQSLSTKSSLVCDAPAESQEVERESTIMTASRPRALAFTRSLSTNTPRTPGSCFLEHLVPSGEDGNAGDPLYGACVKGFAGRKLTGEGRTADDIGAGRCSISSSSQQDVHGRLCQCCGDRRGELIGCTRSPSLLETQEGNVCDAVAAGVQVAAPPRPCQGERAVALSSTESTLQLQLDTVERSEQKHVMAAAATFQARKRHSSCEGRLEGWCAQQLSVRVVVRTKKPPAAPSWNKQDPLITERERLQKKVTFSVDCFSSDGETTSGVLCHLSPPTEQSPLRQPLISRVRSSTCRRPGGVLSRSRFSACRLVGAASASQADGRGVTAAVVTGKAGATAAITATAGRGRGRSGEPVGEKKSAEEMCSVEDALREHRPRERPCVSSDVNLRGPEHVTGCASAAAVQHEGAAVREESFYILVDCRKPPRTSRWSRRGRTVVSRSYTRYLGPLLPLVIDLLEKERESVSTRCKEDRGQTEDKRGRTEQSRLGRPARSTEYTQHPAQQQQQAQKQSKQQTLREPQQQPLQQHLQHQQLHREPVGPQQRQPPQRQQRQQEQPQRRLTQQNKDEAQQSQQRLRGENEQQQPEGMVKTVPSDSTRKDAVPGQSWARARSVEGYSSAVGRQREPYRSFQSERSMPSSYVYPRYYHPLDTPETLFPQARARQLRRLLMLQNTSAFPSRDDPLLLPLLQGNHYGVASPSIERNLAAYHQLGRRSIAARAVATAARHPAMLSQHPNVLQHQELRREDCFSCPHGVPGISSAAAHGRLRYATSRPAGSAGGFWRQAAPAGLRHAASCSFAFEHSRAGESGLAGSYLLPSGTEENRSLEEEEEVETEEDEDDEESDDDEEEERSRRRPGFFRMRRSSGTAAAQDGAQDGKKLPRLSSLGSLLHQRGRGTTSTGEKLKRLLMPLFFRSSSSPAANAEEEKEEETSEREEALGSREHLEEEIMGRLEGTADDEGLWVTESDASTPPSSRVVVKTRTEQKKKQQWAAPSASRGKKRHLLESKKMRSTRQISDTTEREEHSFSANSAAVFERRRNARLDRVELKGKQDKDQASLQGDPQAFELPTVTEEPVEEVEAQGKSSEVAIRWLSEEYQEETEVKTDFEMAASEKTEGNNNCDLPVHQQQHEDCSSQLQQRQEQLLDQLLSHQLKDKEELVEEQTGQPRYPQSQHEPRTNVPQQEHRIGSPGSQPAPQQQLSTTAERNNLALEQNFALQKETHFFHQEHQGTKQQQEQSEQRPQQEQQQHPQPQGSGGETQANEGQRKGEQNCRVCSHLQKQQTAQSRGDQHAGMTAEKVKQQHWFEGETGVRDVLELVDMQKQQGHRERENESVDIDGNEGEEAEHHAVQHRLNHVEQNQPLPAPDAKQNHVQRLGEQNLCKEKRSDQLLVREPAAEQPESAESSGRCKIPLAKDVQVQHTRTQQFSREQKERLDLVGPLLPSSEQENGSENSSNTNQKNTFNCTNNETLRYVNCTNNETPFAENEEVGILVQSKISACETSSRVDDTVTAAEEHTQEKKLEEALSGTRCNSKSKFPIVASLSAFSVSASEEIDSRKKSATRNMRSTSLVMRRALLLKPLRSAEGGLIEVNSKRTPEDGVRPRWRGSTEWGTDGIALEGVDYLPSPAAAEIRTEQITELTRPASATRAIVSATTVRTAAAGAAPAVPLCSDEQIASSTAAGSQQTVNSPVNSWRMPLRKSSLATAFDQMPVPWSTRSARDKKEDTQYFPTLLQRLSTRFRRKRECGTHGSLDEGAVFETPNTT